jgi:hypothetical protein
MPVATVYASLEEIKSRLPHTSSANDADLLDCLLSASREVDGLTGRSFGQTASESRTATAEWGDWLPVDDLVSASAVVTDEDGDRTYEITWAATDYDLEPENASVYGTPYTALRVAPSGTRSFPTGRRGVRITGVWGWPAVPEDVREATLVLAIRLYKRKDAPYGIAGTTELGQAVYVPRDDPDIRGLIAPYRRMGVAAI